MIRKAAKKGKQGILYLTNEPKLDVEMPTAKAKINVNIRQNCSVSSARIRCTTRIGLFLKMTAIEKTRKNNASAAEIITIGFLASHG